MTQLQKECQAAYLMVKDNLQENLSSKRQLTLALYYVGRNPDGKRMEKYWSEKKDGLNYDHFCDMVSKSDEFSHDQLRNAFRKMDRDREGFIEAGELRKMLSSKPGLSEAEFQSIFNNTNINKDGKIDYDEIIRVIFETVEETKRQAITIMEKKVRRETRRKKGERREKGVRKEGENDTKQNNSESSSTVLSKSALPSTSRLKTETEEKHDEIEEQFPYYLKRKGCFLYDTDLEDGEGRSEVVSHQYKINLKERTNIFIEIMQTDHSKSVDTLLFIVDQTGHVCGFTESKNEKNAYFFQCELESGEYRLVPFTTACRFKWKRQVEKSSKAELLMNGNNGRIQLTKQFRMVLMDIFDTCDLDDNGTLNREEFNIYNVRTGDEQVTDEEWKIIQDNFDKRNGEITMKGFIGLHQLEAEDSGGDTEDMWISLQAMGYNDNMQLDEACNFYLDLRSDRIIDQISVHEIQSVPQHYWEIFAGHLISKSTLVQSDNENLLLHCYKNEIWAALIVKNQSTENIQSTLSLDGSVNILVSPENVVQRSLIFGGSSTSILCFILPNLEDSEWNIQAKLIEK